MTQQALKNISSVIGAALLAQLEEYLLIGTACQRDCDPRQVHYPEEAVDLYIPPPENIPANARLTPELIAGRFPRFRLHSSSVDFHAASIIRVLGVAGAAESYVADAAEQLAARIERSLLESTSGFSRSVAGADLADNIRAADQLIFDQDVPDGLGISLVLDNSGCEWLDLHGRNIVQSVLVPADDQQRFMPSNLLFHESALCLVTRHPVLPPSGTDSFSSYAEGKNLTLLLTIRPDTDDYGVSCTASMLYAAGTLRDELGVRIPFTAPAGSMDVSESASW